MRTVLVLALAAGLAGCIDPTPDESGADAGLATTEQDLGVIQLCTTTPTFTNVKQPNVKTLAIHGLTYVSDTFTDVVFTLPLCPWVSGVTVDGVALGTTSTIESPQKYEIVSDTPVTGGHEVRVRVTLANGGTGARKNVKIFATNALIGGAKALDVTWVGVAEVNRASKISMPADQLKNSFATSSYEKFGDDGWELDADGDETGWHDFEYPALWLTVDTSIRFHAAQHKRVYSALWDCDVRVDVDGRFTLSTAPDPDKPGHKKYQVNWVHSAPELTDPTGLMPFRVTISDNNFCTAGYADLVVGFAANVEEQIFGMAKKMIGAGIETGIPCSSPDVNITCADLTAGFEYAPGELRAIINPAFLGADGGKSFTIKHAYAVSAPGVSSGQLVLPANDNVLITSEGLASACHNDVGNPTTCNGTAPLKIGAAGLFNNADAQDWPVPPPYQNFMPPGRLAALLGHVSLNRPTALPAISLPVTNPDFPPPDHDVGALLGRYGTHRSNLGSPCRVHTDLLPGAPPVEIALGRNDHALNGIAYGSGTTLVTVRFAPNGPTNCADF